MKNKLINTIALLIIISNVFAQGSISKLKSIPKEDITKCFAEIGGGAGADYLILWASINANINIYPIQFKNFKVSINNEIGVMLPWARILYYYPSAQIHFPIKNYWFLMGIGREYTQVENAESVITNRIIDYRIDIGLKVYDNDRITSTFTIPLRFDEEIPVYFTGFLYKVNFRF